MKGGSLKAKLYYIIFYLGKKKNNTYQQYINNLKKKKLDEIEYEINEFGSNGVIVIGDINSVGGYINYHDVDEINVHDKSMFFGE